MFGGRSSEHPISIRSAKSVRQAIDPDRFEVVLLGVGYDGAWHLHSAATMERLERDAAAGAERRVVPVGAEGRLELRTEDGTRVATVDLALPILHGPGGEDGTFQGFLETVGVPYVGSGVLGSSVGMDKDVQKRLLREAQIPVVPFVAAGRSGWERGRDSVRRRALELGLPVFVKPANLGSSVGIRKVKGEAELDAAIDHAFAFDTKVVVEKGVDAREIECAVLGNEEPEASVLGEIIPGEEFYSYEDKYSSASKSRLVIPAPLDETLATSMRALAVRAFQVTECLGMARVDFFLERATSRVFVNELNTIPGFTSISMYPKLWEASGLPYRELLSRILELALQRHERRSRR